MSVVTKFSGFVRIWSPAVLATFIIFLESTDTFSAQHTSSILRSPFEALFGQVDNNTWSAVHHAMRKTGHFIGYGCVALAYVHGWLHSPEQPASVARRRWWLRATALGVLCAACIASLDEWHQSFIPSRQGLPLDVFLDTCGALTACILVAMTMRRKKIG